MNSTLSQFLATPGAAPSSSPQLNAAARAGLLSAPAAGGEGSVPSSADFSSLMPVATTATAPLITVSPLLPAQPPVVMPGTPAQAAQAAVASQATPASNAATMQIPSWSRGASVPVGVDSGARAPRLYLTDPATASAEVPEEIREQAVAFVATLMQSLMPEAQVPDQPIVSAQTAGGLTLESAPVLALPNGKTDPHAAAWVARSPITIEANSTMPAPVSVPVPSVPASSAPTTTSTDRSTGVTPTQDLPIAQAELASTKPNGAMPHFVVAEDGTLELKVALPSPAVAELKAAQQKFTDTGVEFQAELEVPGQPLVRVESAGFSAKTAAAELGAAVLPAGQENFAAKNRLQKISLDSARSAGERKFEFTGDKQVTSNSPQDGITVAKTDTTMPAAPTEEPRAARNAPEPMGLPVRAEFQVAQAPAERITAPASAPSGPNFAERAVETVTGLIDAQFSASMQKAGSVQLRLQFGGEDLSVRVEIRDGAVHTDFRTDSAPLRAALEREWQAVAAASPAQMQRYVEPVFSPGASPSSSAHGDARQQSQHQAGAEDQQRAPREGFSDHLAFNRRSLVSESFIPEPSVPRVAAFLPTSLRLSALA